MPPETAPLLSVERLGISIGGVHLTTDVSFTVARGERLGVVGESGCGKTITGLALLRLLPRHARLQGRVLFDGSDLLAMPERAMAAVRGRRIGMIFQEPMSALDPVFTAGEQISETLRRHLALSRSAAKARAIELLDAVGIPLPSRRYRAACASAR
jgi:peptide/nickel transport system ATP-binding protein